MLNLSDHHFDAIRVPTSFDTWGERNRFALDRRDRGYAYGLLLENAKSGPPSDRDTIVDAMLERAGLPDEAAVLDAAKANRAAAYANLLDGPFTHRFNDLRTYANMLGEPADAADGQVSLSKGLLPPIHTGDAKWFRPSGGLRFGTFADPTAWINEATAIHGRFDEFIMACVV